MNRHFDNMTESKNNNKNSINFKDCTSKGTIFGSHDFICFISSIQANSQIGPCVVVDETYKLDKS